MNCISVCSRNAKVYAILLEPKLSIYKLMLFSSNRHTNDMIHKLESAGLGYHVSAEETEDKLGMIPTKYIWWLASLLLMFVLISWYITTNKILIIYIY